MRARVVVGIGIWVAAVVSCFAPGDSNDECKINNGVCVNQGTANGECNGTTLPYSCLAGVCCPPTSLVYIPTADGGVVDGSSSDAQPEAGPSPDVTSPTDAPAPQDAPPDAPAADTGKPTDAAHPEAAVDAGGHDARVEDGSSSDAAHDASRPHDASPDASG